MVEEMLIFLTTLMASAATTPQHDSLEQLRALGYVDTAPTNTPELSGVTQLSAQAFVGVNLLSSRHKATAELLNMHGQVLHTWRDKKHIAWMHVELLPDGALLALSKDHYLSKFSWDSELLWRTATRAHHDFYVQPKNAANPRGAILLLSRDIRVESVEGIGRIPLLADKIMVLSLEGAPIREVSLFPLLRPFVARKRLKAILKEKGRGLSNKRLARPEGPGDILHTNSISVLDYDIENIAPAGSVLLSFRELNRIVILKANFKSILWSWQGGALGLQGQHHATQIQNGHLMVFDNGTRRKQSRVLEIDVPSRKVVWSYTAKGFFSRLRGSAQRLENGNTLTTLSDSGHVFEITKDGQVAWEFWNPDVRRIKNRSERAVIYRLNRYSVDYLKRPL